MGGGGGLASIASTPPLAAKTVGVNVGASWTWASGADGRTRVGEGDGTSTIGDAEELQAKPTANDRVTDKIHAVLILNFGEARSSEFVANIRTLENTHGL